MTLTKSGIKDAIHKELGFTNNKSAELVELMLEIKIGRASCRERV